MRATVGGGSNNADTTLRNRTKSNPEQGKEVRINKYLIVAGIGSAVLGVLFLILLVCLQKSREKRRLLKLAEIKHRRKRKRSHERIPKKCRIKAKKIPTDTEEKKNRHEKLSAEALQSALTPDEVTPDAPKAAASPPTATGGDYVNAADLVLDILTASTQTDVDIQSS